MENALPTEYLTLEEVAELTKRSRTTVYGWVNDGLLPSIQLTSNGKHTILRSDLDKFMAQHRSN